MNKLILQGSLFVMLSSCGNFDDSLKDVTNNSVKQPIKCKKLKDVKFDSKYGYPDAYSVNYFSLDNINKNMSNETDYAMQINASKCSADNDEFIQIIFNEIKLFNKYFSGHKLMFIEIEHPQNEQFLSIIDQAMISICPKDNHLDERNAFIEHIKSSAFSSSLNERMESINVFLNLTEIFEPIYMLRAQDVRKGINSQPDAISKCSSTIVNVRFRYDVSEKDLH